MVPAERRGDNPCPRAPNGGSAPLTRLHAPYALLLLVGKSMVKKPKRAAPRGKPPPQAPPPWVQFPSGPFPFPFAMPFVHVQPASEPRKIADEEKHTSYFTLEDGYKLSITPDVQGVFKMVGQTTAAGDPVYTMQLSWTFEVHKPVATADAKKK